VAAAAAAVVAVGAGTLGVLLTGDGEQEDPGGPSSSSSGSTSSSPVDLGLPRGAPLPDTTLVAPLKVDDDVDLYLLDTASDDQATPLVQAGENDVAPLISPDRTSIVYARSTGGGYELRTVASDGSGDRLLFDPAAAGCASFTRPAWNVADPHQLAVPCSTGDRAEVRLMTLEGATVRTLDPGAGHVDDLTISPDGTQIAYWGADTARGDGGRLFSLRTDGNGSAVPLTDQAGDADPVWSRDGDLIAFRRRTPDGWSRICVMNADGSDEQSLTEGPWIEQDPTWSPDGGWIAFKSNRDGGLPGDQVWVMDRHGDGLRQLGHAVEGTAEAPAWGHR
jgi:Tol biopolymer transport system component